MKELQIFNNPKFGQVRTIVIEGKTYFGATDIAKALGYVNPNDAIIRHCKGIAKHEVIENSGFGTRKMQINVIPEGDIYRLAAKSELPGAEEFESWIFDEVLPSIRKTGVYLSPIVDSKMMFQIAQALEEKEKTIALMQPKADYFDNLVERNMLTNFRDTAKEFKLKESEFIDWLLNKGYIYRDQKKKLKPYAQYVPSLFQIKEFTTALHAGNQTLITPKGRETFRLLLTQISV